MSLFSNFPQGGKKAGVQSISDGGTGATTAEAALSNLGGFPKADGEALKTRIQPINLGGTGASEANQARQNLGAAAVKEMTKAEYDALAAIDPTIFYALTDVDADGVKIEVGSYVGTGTFGASNPNSLTFGFAPKFLLIGRQGDALSVAGDADLTYISQYVAGMPTSYTAGWGFGRYYNGDTYGKKSNDGKTVSWYGPVSPVYQFNDSGTNYYYIAIG